MIAALADPDLGDARADDGAQSVRDAEWTARLRAAEAAARKAQAAVLDLLAEPDAEGIATRSGYGTMPRFLSAALLISTGEARARVAAAEALGPRRTLSGDLLAPWCPATASALRDGRIGMAAARLITETMARTPAGVHPEQAALAEATLAEHARHFAPRPLARLCERVLAHLDPDGRAPRDRPDPGRELHLLPGVNGTVRLHGRLDPEGAAVVRTVLDTLNQPRPDDAAGRDTRTRAERDADALVEACHRLLDDAVLPTIGGQRPHLVVTIGLQQLRDNLGAATLGYADTVDPATTRRLACDAHVIPVVLGGESQPLDVGHAKRTATTAIRAALAVRDGGCTFPGCETPPSRCIAHHITHWADHGPTEPANLTLLCRWHHHLVHHSSWQVRIRNGRAEYIPPALINPDRTPQRNPLRH